MQNYTDPVLYLSLMLVVKNTKPKKVCTKKLQPDSYPTQLQIK